MHLMMSPQRSRTAELLARHRSRTPSVIQRNAQPVPVTLEERLCAAQNMIDQELEDLATLRSEVNIFNDILLQHVLVLRAVGTTFLHQ
jgi:hypothetical protein